MTIGDQPVKTVSRVFISEMLAVASRGVMSTDRSPKDSASWVMCIVSDLQTADAWEQDAIIARMEGEGK